MHWMSHTGLQITTINGVFTPEDFNGTNYPRVSEEVLKKHFVQTNLKTFINKAVASQEDADVTTCAKVFIVVVYVHKEFLASTNDKGFFSVTQLLTSMFEGYHNSGETIYLYVFYISTGIKRSSRQAHQTNILCVWKKQKRWRRNVCTFWSSAHIWGSIETILWGPLIQ